MTAVDPDPAAYPYRCDAARDLWEVGPSWLALHSLGPRAEFTTQTLLGSIHPEDRAGTKEWLLAHTAVAGTSSHAYRMGTGARSGRRVRLVAHTVQDPGTRGFRVDGFLLDITGDISRWQTEAVTASAHFRAAIEQAKGAIMLAFCVDEETAFRMLAGYSQRRNAKLRDVAAFITDAIADPGFANPDHPVESLVDVITMLHDGRTHLRSAPVEACGATTSPGRRPEAATV